MDIKLINQLEDIVSRQKEITQLIGMVSYCADTNFNDMSTYSYGINLIYNLAFENTQKLELLAAEIAKIQ